MTFYNYLNRSWLFCFFLFQVSGFSRCHPERSRRTLITEFNFKNVSFDGVHTEERSTQPDKPKLYLIKNLRTLASFYNSKLKPSSPKRTFGKTVSASFLNGSIPSYRVE